MNDTIEPLGGRQTWMQAQIWIAGTALSLAYANHGVDNFGHAAAPPLHTTYSFSVSSSYQTVAITAGFTTNLQPRAYVARTDLGRKLLELRDRGMRSGMKLLTPAEIRNEVARRRGEIP